MNELNIKSQTDSITYMADSPAPTKNESPIITAISRDLDITAMP